MDENSYNLPLDMKEAPAWAMYAWNRKDGRVMLGDWSEAQEPFKSRLCDGILRTSVFFSGNISSFFDKAIEEFFEFFFPSVHLTIFDILWLNFTKYSIIKKATGKDPSNALYKIGSTMKR